MKIEWEDYRNEEGSKAELSARVLLGTGKFGYDEDVHVLAITVAVFRKKGNINWKCILDGDSDGAIQFRADNLDRAKDYAVSYAAQHIGNRLVPILRKKEQTHMQGMF